ncbi:MAG: nicotinate-nucleotide adenylyltransferase [Alphaproteobacteria bacterium]|nr:nicotinate-nucleotide adenylyltransferase [Alphaproteobacteria bacterium]
MKTRNGNAVLVPAVRRPNLRIGLLGGSFNPAHDGHRHVSLLALRKLGLDEVWWLVSPQNPLKPEKGMAPLKARLRQAEAVARHPRIRVTDLESQFGTRYTIDTLRTLFRAFPGCHFVWLMGADNLAQISKWRDWTSIFRTVPIAVFDRPSYAFSASTGLASRRYGLSCLPERFAKKLVTMKPPVWVFFRTALSPVSATRIRRQSSGSGVRGLVRRPAIGSFWRPGGTAR